MTTTADFPFYNGTPMRLGAWRWCLVLAGVVLGFAVLIAPIPWFAQRLGQFVPAVLFVAIPLASLALATPRHWTVLFSRVARHDVVLMVLSGLLGG